MLIPRRDRGEKDSDFEDAGPTGLARRTIAHATSPEMKLEQLLAERRQELETQASRFEQAMRDLERREELLRDMRASVERLLRLGASDLTEREVELQELGREFMQREARLSEEEAELARRRSELGAVELKREAVEQRERAVAAREAELAAAEAQGSDEEYESRRAEPAPPARENRVALLFVPGPAYRIVEFEQRPLEVGESLEVGGERFVVARFGTSPLPGDPRRCAYLERGFAESSSAGSS